MNLSRQIPIYYELLSRDDGYISSEERQLEINNNTTITKKQEERKVC